MKILVILIFVLSSYPVAICQQVHSKFLSDSLTIGQPVELHFWTYSQSDSSVLFPDSTYNFAPFEYISKKFFPTRTHENISRDCTIYILRTFELDTKQSISLPLLYLSEKDTKYIYSKPATIYLQSLLNEGNDLNELKEQINYHPVRKKINYPLVITIFFVFVIVSVILFKLFGNSIIKRYKIISAIIAHYQFIKTFEQIEKSYQLKKEVSMLEKLQSLWKNYLSRLEEKPVSTYTSTEIVSLYGQEELKKNLQILDRAIFGKILSSEEDKAIKTLKSFTNKRYIIRKNEIRRS